MQRVRDLSSTRRTDVESARVKVPAEEFLTEQLPAGKLKTVYDLRRPVPENTCPAGRLPEVHAELQAFLYLGILLCSRYRRLLLAGLVAPEAL